MAVCVAALMPMLRRSRFVDRWDARNAIGIVPDGNRLSVAMLTYIRFEYVGRRMATTLFCIGFRATMSVVITASKNTVSQNVQRRDGGDKFVCERHGAKRNLAETIFYGLSPQVQFREATTGAISIPFTLVPPYAAVAAKPTCGAGASHLINTRRLSSF